MEDPRMSTISVPTRPPKLRTIHLLLSLQTLIIILGSLNRLGSWTLGYVAPNEFLRWVDLLNMLPIPMLTIAVSGVLFFVLAYDNGHHYDRWHKGLGLLFLLAVYVFGASYGNHEVTNYLNSRFCIETPLPDGEDLCRIVIYNDDEFSHYLFFAAFVAINTILMGMQVLFPHTRLEGSGSLLSRRDIALLVFNGLFIALGVMANLAFEEIGLDLVVIVLLALIAVGLLWRYGRQPLLIYYTVAYWVGLGLTILVKLLR
jgi:hypothetical protein